MFKRAISIVLFLVLLPQFTGCTSVKAVNLTDVERPVAEKVYGVITVDGEPVDFDQPSTDFRNDTIYAWVNESQYSIALDDVQQLQLMRPDRGRTVMLVAVAAVAVYLAVNAAIEEAFEDWPEWGGGEKD